MFLLPVSVQSSHHNIFEAATGHPTVLHLLAKIMREVLIQCERFSDINWEYMDTMVIFHEDGYYYISFATDRFNVDTDSLEGSRIPIETQLCKLPQELQDSNQIVLRASDDLLLSTECHVKKLQFHRYLPGNENLPEVPPLGQALIDELLIYEILRANPHPNICKYHGYAADPEGYVTGLCLRKYPYSLVQAVYRKINFDEKIVLDDIRKAISHLHSLGLVHNDLTPGNIMIDEHGRGVLIDFGECKNEGTPIGSQTPFFEFPSKVTIKENDYWCIERVTKWVADKGQGSDWQGKPPA